MRKPTPLRSIGKCIYCGTPEGRLTEEHIVPLALDGHLSLEKASCDPCAAITSKFELSYCRATLGVVRAALKFPSRNKKKQPKSRPVKITSDEVEREEEILIEEAPIFLPTVEFELPGYLRQRGVTTERELHDKIITFNMVPLISPKRQQEFSEKYRAESYSIDEQFNPNDFVRMLAKIAYCSVVARHGPDCFEEAFVLPAILRNGEEASHWVGCDGSTLLKADTPRNLHVVQPQYVVGFGGVIVLVRLKLFVRLPAPEYVVVVGRLTKECQEQIDGLPEAIPAEAVAPLLPQRLEVYLGGIRFLDVPTLVTYEGRPIVTINRKPSGELEVELEIYDDKGNHCASVRDNKLLTPAGAIADPGKAQYEIRPTVDRYAVIDKISKREVCVLLGNDLWLHLFMPNGKPFEATPTGFETLKYRFLGASATGSFGINCLADGSATTSDDYRLVMDNYGTQN